MEKQEFAVVLLPYFIWKDVGVQKIVIIMRKDRLKVKSIPRAFQLLFLFSVAQCQYTAV